MQEGGNAGELAQTCVLLPNVTTVLSSGLNWQGSEEQEVAHLGTRYPEQAKQDSKLSAGLVAVTQRMSVLQTAL